MPVPEGGNGWVCQKTAAKIMNWLPVHLPSIKMTHGRHEVGVSVMTASNLQLVNSNGGSGPHPATTLCLPAFSADRPVFPGCRCTAGDTCCRVMRPNVNTVTGKNKVTAWSI